MESQVLHALGKIQTRKTLKFHIELNFYNSQEREMDKFLLIATTFTPLELTLLDFVSTLLVK